MINNTFLERSGIDPHSALYKDDPKNPAAEPYINALVTRAENKNNPAYLQLAELWHDPEVQKAHNDVTKGTAVEVRRRDRNWSRSCSGCSRPSATASERPGRSRGRVPFGHEGFRQGDTE
ncbi:MetQ/NlpA family ABC transporter substrate-binding protein [Nocardia amamiensis]|uniref:MetQ/NlpA family ABC transporter substrate-binding protein n=1 Tax=Nocardia amamiensis TaxID=404578 RepID=UPI0033D8E66D